MKTIRLNSILLLAASFAAANVALAQTPEIVYNAGPTVNTGTSALNANNPVYGDDMFLTHGGTLSDLGFALFNSSSGGNTGLIIKGTMLFNFYDGDAYSGTGAPGPALGSFTANLDYSSLSGGGLAPGFYITDSVTGLDSLGIVLPSHTLITQKFTLTEGTSLRNGTVSAPGATVGTGTPTHFFLQSAVNNPAYYTFGATTPSDIYYVVSVIPEPASAAIAGLGLAALLIFRRRAQS